MADLSNMSGAFELALPILLGLMWVASALWLGWWLGVRLRGVWSSLHSPACRRTRGHAEGRGPAGGEMSAVVDSAGATCGEDVCRQTLRGPLLWAVGALLSVGLSDPTYAATWTVVCGSSGSLTYPSSGDGILAVCSPGETNGDGCTQYHATAYAGQTFTCPSAASQAWLVDGEFISNGGTAPGVGATPPGGGASAPSTVTGTVSLVCAPPLCMSSEQGGLVGAAICAVWFAGWAIRVLVNVLRAREDGD